MAKYLYNGIEAGELPEEIKRFKYQVVVCDIRHEEPERKLYNAYAANAPLEIRYYEAIGGFMAMSVNTTAPGEYGFTSGARSDFAKPVVMNTSKESVSIAQTFADERNTLMFWANFDLYDDDGNLVVAASDPIPLTPAEPVKPAALLTGWQLGKLVQRLRGQA